MVFGDDIGDADAPAWGEDAEHLGEDGGLVGRQVDDAVGDHHAHRPVRQRHVLDRAFQELHVGGCGLGCVLTGEVEHLVGHIHAVGEPRLADPLGRQQHVDPAA
ncbi:hypothetical protein SDC9_170130 [bioreactor metagenome]|uniref:Uncharacterized protein n=1 Tax=bioreactor metagenome TaxID=1076179 RepID=A0A645G776_9ZZZZ